MQKSVLSNVSRPGVTILIDGMEDGEFLITFQLWMCFNVFHNAALLGNKHEGKIHMDIHCDSRVTSTKMVGEMPGYGTVWYHPNGIANILSLSRVKERGYRVTHDSTNGNEFMVH